MPTLMPVTLEQGKAACSEPEHLALVDAAHAKPGGPAAKRMRAELCNACPVFEQCLGWAMTHGEIGVWAGTSPNLRGRHGAPKGLPPTPDYLHRGGREGVPAQAWRRKKPAKPRAPEVTVIRLAELGLTAPQVKAWALEQGIIQSTRGRVALTVIEAYAVAHQAE